MKIVVSDCDHKTMDIEKKVLGDAGLSFEHFACRTEDEVISQLKGVNVVFNQYAPFNERVFSALEPALGLVVRYGVGVDNIDLEAATRHGVQICNVPDYGMHEVSDHALGLLLSLVRKIPYITGQTKSHKWDYRQSIPVRRVKDLTVGILGAGRIGLLFARKVAAIGCEIVFNDPYVSDLDKKFPGARLLPFDEFMSCIDVLSLHCPLSDETRGLIDARALARMRPGALIINTARGGIIDEEALADAVESTALGGAAIDTVEREPLSPNSRLLSLENCLVTPHMAWYSEQSAQELKLKVAEEGVRFARGEPPRYPVNHPDRVAGR